MQATKSDQQFPFLCLGLYRVQNNSPGTCTENIFTTTDFALYFGDIFNGWSHLENKLNETKFLFSKKNCKNV